MSSIQKNRSNLSGEVNSQGKIQANVTPQEKLHAAIFPQVSLQGEIISDKTLQAEMSSQKTLQAEVSPNRSLNASMSKPKTVLAYTVDDQLSETSINPVQNKVIASKVKEIESELENKAEFIVDDTLRLNEGVLGVNTATEVKKDNTLPITSGGVYTEIGNISVLLETI